MDRERIDNFGMDEEFGIKLNNRLDSLFWAKYRDTNKRIDGTQAMAPVEKLKFDLEEAEFYEDVQFIMSMQYNGSISLVELDEAIQDENIWLSELKNGTYYNDAILQMKYRDFLELLSMMLKEEKF